MDTDQPKPDDFQQLPQWPAGAKDLSESASKGPPRSRAKWFIGFGLFGGVSGLIKLPTDVLLQQIAIFMTCFICSGLVGLLIERAIFDRERHQRRGED